MYPSVRSIPGADAPASPARRSRVLSQNLIALGLTSFFTDISSEMVVAIVPLFLTTSVGFSIAGFGLYEAAYQAINAGTRIWGGSVADNRQSYKKTAATGYSISAATRLGLVLSSLVAAIPAVPFLLADRIGKGLRTAPRDALISLSTGADRLGTAFGIHRAFDTAGALLGPLVAFLVLSSAPGAFDAVFVMSSGIALIGVAIIWLFAHEQAQAGVSRSRQDRRPFLDQWREVLGTPRVGRLGLAAALMAMFTVGDSFVYLVILRATDMSARFFPLLFVGTAIAYLVLAIPVGRLSDRIGARRVLLGGNVLLVILYAVLGFGDLGRALTLACLALLGAYYAATDGVVPAMVSRLVGVHIRASGIAFVTVMIAVAKMISAALFGVIWHTVDQTTALVVFAVALGVAVLIATQLLGSESERVSP